MVQGDKPQLMDWEEYGLRISIPEGSLSSSETIEIAVIVLVGGHFKYVLFIIFNFLSLPTFLLRFPKNTRLVSAIYAISASHLLKSLKLEVQHCIDLNDPSLCKFLNFVVAPVHTSSLPYQFNIVEGGEFPANSRYGFIERSKFCLLGIVGEEQKNGGQNNGEEGNGEQDMNDGVQQEQSNGHEDSEDDESGDEGKGGGGNQQGGSGQQQQGEGGERTEIGGQEQLQQSHWEEENECQQQKIEELHQTREKEKQQHKSKYQRQPTKEEKDNSNA